MYVCMYIYIYIYIYIFQRKSYHLCVNMPMCVFMCIPRVCVCVCLCVCSRMRDLYAYMCSHKRTIDVDFVQCQPVRRLSGPIDLY